MLADYFGKMRGTTKSPPRASLTEVLWSWVGALAGIGIVAFANDYVFQRVDLILIIGSFGASAVLIFGAIKSPFAQPRNFVGGQVLSAVVGVTCHQLLQPHLWVASAVAVATAIAVMHLTKTLHPPGGATALIAVIGGAKIHELGYLYVLFPVAGGSLILLVIALVFNNLPRSRRYPEFWV